MGGVDNLATVFLSRQRFAVVVYSNDHPPPHVHARGKDKDARFILACPEGPVELWDYAGKWTRQQLQSLGEEIAEKLTECCEKWEEIHG